MLPIVTYQERAAVFEPATAEELNAAIDHVLANPKPFISPRIPRRSFRDGAAVEHPALDRLTPRHRQIRHHRLVGLAYFRAVLLHHVEVVDVAAGREQHAGTGADQPPPL